MPVVMGTDARKHVWVSESIDHTGATDVTSALQAAITGASNGSAIHLQPDGIYRCDHSLNVSGRSNLTFEGHGAEIRGYAHTGSYLPGHSKFRVSESTNIKFHDLILTGTSPTPGQAILGQEIEAGFEMFDDVFGIEIWGCTIKDLYGDGIRGYYVVDDLWAHDNVFSRCGRAHIVLEGGHRWLVENNTFYLINNSVGVVDIEPFIGPPEDQQWNDCTYFTFRNNAIRQYAVGQVANFYFAANCMYLGSGWTMDHFTFTGNTAYNGSLRSILGVGGDPPRYTNIVITNNVALGAAQAWNPQSTACGGFQIAHCDGVLVTGNSVTFSPSHVLATFTECTGVTKDF